MKFLKIVAAFFVFATIFTACSKDDNNNSVPPTPAFSIEGMWSGKIGNNNDLPTGQYALNILPGGVLKRVNGAGTETATGTWQLSGDSFSGTYTYASGTVVVFTATVNKALKKISGDWHNNSEVGTFVISKKIQ
jgi:hypothetical protein